MPFLPDKGACIAIYDRGNIFVDEMSYSMGEQFPLLEDYHGVSLERVLINRIPGRDSEWHSASSICGFATPGYVNSQNISPWKTESIFFCREEVFTPDNDGYRDVAIIDIKMEKEGYVAMIRVFDASGRLIRIIANNELMGTHNTVVWDGRDGQGMICHTGIYLIHMEAYHLSGSKKVCKETVVLGRK